jgi:hypothetical protein
MVRASGDCATDNEIYLAVARLGLMSASSVGVVVLRQVVKLVELDLRKVRMMKMQEITIIY